MPPSPNIVFRAVPPLDAALTARCEGPAPAPKVLSEAARRDLTRYYALLAAELATVAAELSPAEALLICDALMGTLVDDQLLTVRHLDHEIDDALDDGLAEKWKADGPALLARIRSWTTGQRLAVVDAVERFHRLGDGLDYEPALRQVGLLPALGMRAGGGAGGAPVARP